MPKRKILPVALTIAGSDSGGGAGIQADLKTFAALGVHGASAIACLTAQNPKRVLGIETVSPQMLRQQLEAVFEELNPRAVKTGMLFSAGNVSVVAEFFTRHFSPSPQRGEGRGEEAKIYRLKSPHPNSLPAWAGRGRKIAPPLIVDPILISTSGTRLLEPKALKILKDKLLPLATLATPNLSEAEILSGQKISSLEETAAAAHKIHARFGCAVLIKGGHLKNLPNATDLFFDGKDEFLLSAPFVKNVRTHGTGCTYSAAICAALALGKNLPQAVQSGKKFVTTAIVHSYKIGNHFALNHSNFR
ncbi:MAG TPA: bifunctional hydroxymethylpyrimidine kinase/phosphomethylpyrimidine kinase [Verrucomicrobiae bacterium]|nr:bifunctional hydroxymethylpyrimidine kinase/phosphomethylpyrimidine kinase [Verrucomicrobiae bacterium]